MMDLILPLDVAGLLPQKPPIVMVDTLLECSRIAARTRFFIRDDNIFVQDGIFREEGLLENIAQTAAAQVTILYTKGTEYRQGIGYIGSISRIEINQLPAAGSAIETHISVLHQFQNVTIISGYVRQGERRMAGCEMKIFARVW